jgi:hypothetical protein
MTHELTLQKKIEAYRMAEKAVLEHPMTLRFIKNPHHFIVILPNCVAGVDAVRVAKGGNKTKALKRLYDKLEDLWKLDNPVLYPNG